MKKSILLLALLFPIIIAFSNVTPMSSAYISELYFDENGDWTIEIYFEYFAAEIDTGYLMITSTDTATFKKFPDSSNIVLLTNSDLSKPLFIDKSGDIVWFENPDEFQGGRLTEFCVFGDYPGAKVNALFTGQSLVGISYKHVKDTSSSLGYRRDPQKGILEGYVYDSIGTPLPYIKVQISGIGTKTLWSDENGFFSDTLYAKNYEIFIIDNSRTRIYSGGFTIEPDSLTIHDITLPVSAEIQFSGYSFLVGIENHSNIKIYLTPLCPFAPPDTIVTDSTGNYSKTIAIGNYYLRYSHENYQPYYTYGPLDIFLDFQMYDTYLEEGGVNEITDSIVSGRWTSDHPYWIFTNLTIAENDTLIIDPGVQINFKRVYHWNVYGTLLAEGTDIDSIFITSNQNNWGAFNFNSEASSGSSIKYANISFPESINFYNSNATIQNSSINWNAPMRFFDSASPTIDGCLIDLGVYLNCYDNSSPIIKRNKIKTEIRCHDSSSPKIQNNNLFNSWIGIYFDDQSTPDVNSNIFYNLGFGIWEHRVESDYYHIYNNLFYDCEPVWWYFGYLPDFAILTNTNYNGDSCDIYFNLFMDPMFNDPGNGDFTLMPESPCVDAGNPGFEYDPDSTIADIGALYFDQTSVFIRDKINSKPEINLFHYPNPASEFVNFVIEGEGMSELNNAYIKIYNLTGSLVGEISCPSVDKGFGKKIYRYDLDNQNLTKTGTYLYQFEANGKVLATNKMILVK